MSQSTGRLETEVAEVVTGVVLRPDERQVRAPRCRRSGGTVLP